MVYRSKKKRENVITRTLPVLAIVGNVIKLSNNYFGEEERRDQKHNNVFILVDDYVSFINF